MIGEFCQADGIGLVNIVRSQTQENTLRALAESALVMRNPTFVEVYAQVDSGEQPDEEENQHAPAG